MTAKLLEPAISIKPIFTIDIAADIPNFAPYTSNLR